MKEEIIDLSTSESSKKQVDYLSRLAYEVEANKNIVVEIMERHRDDPSFLDSAIFKEYHKRFEKSVAAFDIGKTEFGNTFVPEKFKNISTAVWNLTYADYKMVITY